MQTNNQTIRYGVGFSSSGSISSKIIKYATDSQASHTFIVVDDTIKPYIIQSTFAHGVQQMYWSDFYTPSIQSVFEIPYNLSSGVAWMQECAKLKWKYSPEENLGDAILLLLKKVGINWLHNPFVSRNRINCSAAVMNVLHLSKVPGAFTHPEDATPEDCLQLVRTFDQMKPFSPGKIIFLPDTENASSRIKLISKRF